MIEEENNPKRKLVTVAIALVILGLLCWGAYTFFNSLSTQAPPKKQKIQKIELVAPPPPPPPPPPPEMEEPEPEPEPEEEIPEPEPEPEPVADDSSDEPPPGDDLGLDAEGVAGSDGFGLVGKKGGRGLIGGGGGSRFAWFAGALKQDLMQLLSNNDDVRQGEYDVIVKVWISADGRVERSELVGSSGKPDLDQALLQSLAGRPKLSERPPEDMPQPVKLRIKSRI